MFYIWDSQHFKKYKDVDLTINTTSRARKDVNCTLYQFKQLIQSGESIGNICAVYNKHLIGFYSFFCQKQNILSKQKMQQLINNGIQLKTIAAQNRIPFGYITPLRALYGVKKKGANYIKRKKTETTFSQIQKQVILGSLMGDASKGGQSSKIRIKQSQTQYEYLKWKFQILKDKTTPAGITRQQTFDSRYNKTRVCYQFFTSASSYVQNLNNQIYHATKQPTMDHLMQINQLGLATWYMDDGTIDWKNKHRQNNWNSIPQIKLCTDSFSPQSCDLIVNWLMYKFNIKSHKRQRQKNSNQFRIIIDTCYAYNFINLIKPHIIPSMMYKVNYQAYKVWRKDKEKLKIIK